VQYFELRGNRAITSGRWRAVALHDCDQPYANDRWELFDLDSDFSEHGPRGALSGQGCRDEEAVGRAMGQVGTGELAQPGALTCRYSDMFDRKPE
jgi:arylsulfatase